jgi:hypothetical protein
MGAFSSSLDLFYGLSNSRNVVVALLRKLFGDHPASVGETYFEHLITATSFGMRMILGGVACMVHGLVPGIFMTRGSDTVSTLHERMVVSRQPKIRKPLIQ